MGVGSGKSVAHTQLYSKTRKATGLKYGFSPRIIQTKIFQNNNLDMAQKGLAKYGGRGPKIAVVINGQSSNFFVWR